MKGSLKEILLLIAFVLIAQVSQAQPGDPGPEPVPIGAIELLVAAGGALGLKKSYRAEGRVNNL